jgi:TRAP-type uncharacterized transport system fused permease subunit
VFNTDLLLIDVTSPWRVAVIFATSLIGMFAFAALTQWFAVARNRWYESLMLGTSTLILLRPQLLPGMIGRPPAWLASRYTWYLAGLALYAGTIALQWPRRTPGQAPASGMVDGAQR